MLERLILREAAQGNFRAPRGGAFASITSGRSCLRPGGVCAGCPGRIGRHSAKNEAGGLRGGADGGHHGAGSLLWPLWGQESHGAAMLGGR